MKRYILAILIILACCIEDVDAAEHTGTSNNYWYISANVGHASIDNEYNEKIFNQTKWSFDDGPSYSIATGYNLKDFRLEADLSYRTLEFNKWILTSTNMESSGSGKQDQYSLMLNGIWSPNFNWDILPFIGAGIGYTEIEWENVAIQMFSGDIDDSATVFTYQIILGLSYEVSDRLLFDLTYKYIKPGDVELTSSYNETGKFGDQEIDVLLAGVRYKF